MSQSLRPILLFSAMAIALLAVGFGQGWSVMLVILNLCLISAVMSVGLNMQWGYAGLFNAGVMAFVAVGGMVAVLISEPPVRAGWEAGGLRIGIAGLLVAVFIGLIYAVRRFVSTKWIKNWGTAALLVAGYFIIRPVFEGGVTAVESIAAASAGNLGGLGLNILVSWGVAAVVCVGVAWVIGRIALGLRADYLAIATLGISEIVVAVAKNEEWMTRGVKNITSLSALPSHGKPTCSKLSGSKTSSAALRALIQPMRISNCASSSFHRFSSSSASPSCSPPSSRSSCSSPSAR